MRKTRLKHNAKKAVGILTVLTMTAALCTTTAYAGVTDVTGGSGVNVSTTVVQHYTDENSYTTISFLDGVASVEGDYSCIESVSFKDLPVLTVNSVYDKKSDTTTLTADISGIERSSEDQVYTTDEYVEVGVITKLDRSTLTYNGIKYGDGTIFIGDSDEIFDENKPSDSATILETRDDYYTRTHQYVKYELTVKAASDSNKVINKVVIVSVNAPAACIVGVAPKAVATKGDDGAYTFYEYWEEWAETENGFEPVKFWYSDDEQMSRVPADKRITTFEKDKPYSYSIIAQANENYTFASKDALSVMLDGEDYTDISEVILNGKSLMIGPGFTVAIEQKEIELIEISDATVSFNIDDKPVFTGTVDDDAPYVLDYEGWFGEDGEFISSSEYWNSAYVERDWCDGLISSFKENTEYTYQLYLKLTDEASAEGYVFGPNTKLIVNGKDVEYQHSGETSVALQIGTDLTMTPTKPVEKKEIPVVEINNATLTFNDGDKPVFTGTVPDDAKYRLVFEEWRTDGEWTRSDEWFNDAEHHGDDKDITAFDKNKSYNYNLYLTLNAEGSEDGWYFGQNTKLKINGKEVSYVPDAEYDEYHFGVITGITMTPTDNPTEPTDTPTDTPTKPTQNSENETPTTDVPKTADSESAFVWFAVMLISVAGTAIVLSKKRHAE